MADSSPGLQNPASPYLSELAHTQDNLPPNLAAQKETSARLASEFLAGQTQPTGGGAEGLKRAANVLAGGLADGIADSAKHSLNLNTAKSVAESLGIGYGLGALAKAGPVGEKLAMASGLVMGATWVYSELERGRPQATIGAVADAYNNKDHAAQDRKIVATNGGALAFETGLAFAAGGLGMKKGLELKTNWQVDALAGVKNTYGNAVDFLARDGRVNGAHVLNEGDMGTAFAGKDANAPASAMSLAKEIISGKDKGGTSLADIQQTFARSEAKRNDAHLLDIQSKLVSLDSEHAQIRAEETALSPKMANATREKAALESLTPLENTVRVRQQALADAQQAARDLGPKKKELDKLFTEKQAAFELQKPKDGQPADPKLREDFQAKHQNFLDVKARYDELKANGSPESIERHRDLLTESQTALQQAREQQPVKLAEAQRQIDVLNEQLAALKSRRTVIEDQVKPLVDSYNNRLKEVLSDPAKLVQAKFDPPPQKAAAVKEAPVKAPPTEVHVAVDLQPGFIKADGTLKTGGGTAGDITAVHTEAGPKTVPVAEPAGKVIDVAPPKEVPALVSHEAASGANTAALIEQPAAKGTTGSDHPVEKAAAPALDRKAGGSDAPAERTATADATDVAPGVKMLSREAQTARDGALKAVKSNELVRERDYATRVLEEIGKGTYKPARGASVADVKLDMERRITDVNQKLGNDPGIKYTRALKSVLQYTRSVSKQLAETPDAGMRDVVTQQALTDIEGMMGRLPTSYKGYPGKLPDLAEPLRGGRQGSPEKRFSDVSDHLEAKVANLDNSRARQVTDMAEKQPTLSEIMSRLNKSELPDDGSIILVGKDGKYLGPKGGTSPYFIEVARMKANGVGADGGGFNRFEGIQNDIAGAVILRPIYENGKPVELPGRSTNGKPVYRKTVVETFGDVPEGITPNLNFADILRRFSPAR
jgi:hypothetical protein